MKDKDKIYIVGHKNPDTDSICSAIGYAHFLRECGEDAVAARSGDVNPETEYVLDYFGFEPPQLLQDAEGKKVILVDHNEASQSPDNIDNAEIVGVLDHHRINFAQWSPIYFHTEPLGSTATMVAREYLYGEEELPKEIAGILLSSILSDTVVFKSPTTTQEDMDIAEMLAEIAEIDDIEEFGIDVKRAKASIKGKSAKDVIFSDFKDFNFSGKKVGIGQIEIVGFDETDEVQQELISELNAIQKSGGYSLLVLMATNIMEECSRLLVVGDKSYVERAFGKDVKDNVVHLPNVMSRKKDIVAPLDKVF